MGTNDFDPFEGMDPDNINYVHSINYDEMRDVMHSLPPGWKRLDAEALKPGQPHYVHEPMGETSWKNPNMDKLMNIADELVGKKRKENNGANSR